MVQIFRTDKGQLLELTEPTEGCWINITNPTAEDKTWVEANIPYLEEYIGDSLDTDEQSRVEKDEDFTVIVMRIPHFQGREFDPPFTTMPLLVFFDGKQIVTVCKEENVVIQEFLKERIKGFNTAKRNTFLLQIMFKTANKYLLHLRNINKIVDQLEDELENSLRNREIMALLRFEKVLIYYTTALRTNEAMMERLKRMRIFKEYEDDEDLLEDLLIENQQAIEMTNITRQVLSQLMNAYSSVINNNMNNVIKFLTLVTICLSVPTLITSFYGMNVHLPLQDNNNAVYIIISLCVLAVTTMAIFFYRKRWF